MRYHPGCPIGLTAKPGNHACSGLPSHRQSPSAVPQLLSKRSRSRSSHSADRIYVIKRVKLCSQLLCQAWNRKSKWTSNAVRTFQLTALAE